MYQLRYNESKPRGTFDFPIELYHVDADFPQYQMPLHWHMEHELLRVLSGSLRLSLDEREYTLGAGDIVLINSETLHSALAADCVYQCIVFDMSMLYKPFNPAQHAISAFAGREAAIHPLCAQGDEELSMLVHQLFEAMQHRLPGYELSVQGLLYQILGRIVQKDYRLPVGQSSRTRRKTRQLKQVLELVETAYTSRLTLDDMARAACMSPKYFCQFFREMTHETPVDYLNHYRVERAAHLLISTDCTVTEAAYECGFHDLSYFIRSFKKYKGITPRRYRLRFVSSPPADKLSP